ncbi:hypothetical protein XvhCFBP2543_12925 [Xanthomonas vasicola]|nr:hypothetical protein NX04_18885 [Xanthomonas vasicola]KGR46779.1 hypothetical protein NX05_03915 [Xanthomonas vasicola]KGR59593.1 hypothetical protein NX79_14290 [Xanthomonas vasicola]PPV02206.1 hypothetical protein XvhCFBP2543_12925 [Xanthomonas vasicola]
MRCAMALVVGRSAGIHGRWLWCARRGSLMAHRLASALDAAMDQHGIVASEPRLGKATTGGCFVPSHGQSTWMQL